MAKVNEPMERLHKLLSMAAGTANIAEANIAAVKAAELMRLHRIRPDDLFRTEYVFVSAEPATKQSTRRSNKWATRLGKMIGFLLMETVHIGRSLIFVMIARRM